MILLQVPSSQELLKSESKFKKSRDEQKVMRMTLLKDIEPIMSLQSDNKFLIRLGMDVTNVSDFTWPAGVAFKLIGLNKKEVASYKLEK